MVEPLLVAAAIVALAHWQANEEAELLTHSAQSDLYGEEVAVVGRPVECADMVTAGGEYGQAVGNALGETVVAAMGLGIQNAIL